MAETAITETTTKPPAWWRRGGSFIAIWPVTALLFLISPLVASGSLSHDSLTAMLPFAGVLAIAAIGQTLVIQQGGLDLSVPGTFSLGVVLVVVVPGGESSHLVFGLLVVAAAGLGAGLLNGLAVSRFGITPLVVTLGMNGVLLGVQQQVTGGTINHTATDNWSSLVGHKLLGVPIVAVFAFALALVVATLMRRTVAGREFELVGAGPRTAAAAGLPVARYQIASYALAGLCYALAGALLAGFLGRPQLDAGNEYLLPTIAAVVLGGTALGGGRGSVVATAGGVLFLAQLDQLLQVLGVSQAIQNVIQGAIVALSMGLRNVPFAALRRIGSPPRAERPRGSAAEAPPAGTPTVSTHAPTL
ncbi:MAG TPA: ABC transporter permease [Baekduia sp.]|nr:ABC transporter permease [Baekduia sp.]